MKIGYWGSKNLRSWLFNKNTSLGRNLLICKEINVITCQVLFSLMIDLYIKNFSVLLDYFAQLSPYISNS